ncbi:uncharacterized protein CANTADRAFT_319182 [Suhomyces tanzawaensis NRRL Y-17324]|uniref:HORMA domain-containing protein n=1 Tax=Suhomyces tanzawaensis NRRL Y-17324 TaxID=984487 RepID=A0A1E4SDM7_9ASCO|nr:uncharacterized protein CANTADRAFT_319182 [Suhomyces tanzawaensis NRRL Y-17324]ODV77621.1 hypothetical protein CANTADRAFT_319182 [Suhomyces tanzawaensis NRRL Y-17324]
MYNISIPSSHHIGREEFIHAAVGSICYLRNMFQESAFTAVSIGDTRLKCMKLAKGNDLLADTLLHWIEQGVLSTLRLGYLKGFLLCIHPDERTILEAYVFSISKTSEPQTNERPLKELIQSLQKLKLQTNRIFLSIRILYNQACPKKYQPAHFEDNIVDDAPKISIDINSHNQFSPKSLGIDFRCPMFEGIRLDPLDVIERDDPETENLLNSVRLLPLVHSTLSCDSGCKLMQLGTSSHAQCYLCNRVVNIPCYGYLNNRIPETFSCYTCQFNSPILSDLQLLMRIRLLWAHILHNGEIPTMDQVYEMFQLNIGDDRHDENVRQVFNKLFQDGVFQTEIAPSSDSQPGYGMFMPKIRGLFDPIYNKELLPSQLYWLIFVPKAQKMNRRLEFNTAIQLVYFSEFSRIKSCLKRFEDSCRFHWLPRLKSIPRSICNTQSQSFEKTDTPSEPITEHNRGATDGDTLTHPKKMSKPLLIDFPDGPGEFSASLKSPQPMNTNVTKQWCSCEQCQLKQTKCDTIPTTNNCIKCGAKSLACTCTSQVVKRRAIGASMVVSKKKLDKYSGSLDAYDPSLSSRLIMFPIIQRKDQDPAVSDHSESIEDMSFESSLKFLSQPQLTEYDKLCWTESP